MRTPSPPPPEMSPDQKLDLIIGAQRRVQKNLGIDPNKTLAENVQFMKNHPDSEIRRRFGNLDTASTTVDPFTDKKNLGEQTDLVAFALRDFTTEAGRPKIHLLDAALRRAEGFEDWSTSLKPGQAWQADIDAESTKRIEEMQARREAELDQRADRMIQTLGQKPDGEKPSEAPPASHPWSKLGGILTADEMMAKDADSKETSMPVETAPTRAPSPSTMTLKDLQRLQNDLSTARVDGTASGWTQAQRDSADAFVDRDLKADWENRAGRAALQNTGVEMGLLLQNSRIDPSDPAFSPREISRVRVSGPAAVQEQDVASGGPSSAPDMVPVGRRHPGWQGRSPVPEAEPTRYEVKIQPGGPKWNGSPGFGDKTEIPETQTASYDVGLRRSSRASFSSASAPSEPVIREQTAYDAPAVSRGSYSHHIDNGITWSGGRSLRQDFGPPAGYDPGPPPAYGRPSTGLGALLEGASVAAARHGLRERMDDMSWHDRRDLMRDLHAGFGPRPVENVVGSLVGPFVRGLGL